MTELLKEINALRSEMIREKLRADNSEVLLKTAHKALNVARKFLYDEGYLDEAYKLDSILHPGGVK